jgi:hypothetical protein
MIWLIRNSQSASRSAIWRPRAPSRPVRLTESSIAPSPWAIRRPACASRVWNTRRARRRVFGSSGMGQRTRRLGIAKRAWRYPEPVANGATCRPRQLVKSVQLALQLPTEFWASCNELCTHPAASDQVVAICLEPNPIEDMREARSEHEALTLMTQHLGTRKRGGMMLSVDYEVQPGLNRRTSFGTMGARRNRLVGNRNRT